jgi:CarboxypepD_reg-like domain
MRHHGRNLKILLWNLISPCIYRKNINPMEKQLVLSVPKPCSEKWSGFTSTQSGKMCATCSKVVVDFTGKSETEIVRYFSTSKEKTCGRFRASQVVGYSVSKPMVVNPGWKLLTASVLMLLMIFIGKPSIANTLTVKADTEVIAGQPQVETIIFKPEITVKGIVKDEEGLAMAGVNIYLKGSTIGTISGVDGKFEFPQKLREGDIIVFSFIGMETKEYAVRNDMKDLIEISLVMDGAIMMGDVVVSEIYTQEPSGIAKLWNKVKGIF